MTPRSSARPLKNACRLEMLARAIAAACSPRRLRTRAAPTNLVGNAFDLRRAAAAPAEGEEGTRVAVELVCFIDPDAAPPRT